MKIKLDNKLAEALCLLQSGQLKAALNIFLRVIAIDPLHPAATSGATSIFLAVARQAGHQQQWDKAYKNYCHVISFDPDHAEARQRLLDLIPQYLLSKTTGSGISPTSHSDQNHLILGIGTGRCGSSSLTKLLLMQNDTYVSHEHGPMLPWVPDISRFQYHVDRFRILLSICKFAGDVSHWWLPYLKQMLSEFPTLRVACIKRDREDTVRSFEEIKGTGPQAVNHWINHNGNRWKRNLWDSCYPKYDVLSRTLALSLYWEEYYVMAAELSRKYPENIRVYEIDLLGTEQGQKEILGFYGYDNPVTTPDLALNRGDTRDGYALY